MNNYSAEDILEAREKRVELQERLLKKYKSTLICLRVNYPGINKDNEICRNIINIIEEIISEIYESKITLKLLKYTPEGPVLIIILKEEPMAVKKITLEIEEKHMLGRCVDIDVYDAATLKSISRESFGIPKRKCFLCEEYAHNCVRSQKHSVYEVIEYINKCYKEYMENYYGKK